MVSKTENKIIKNIHYFSALVIAVFVALHLFNHTWALLGASKHVEMMNTLRLFYRNIFVELILVTAVLVQITSGIKLFKAKRKTAESFFEQLQIWSGLYLAIFFIIHLSAVMGGRFIFNLDTNFYFGVAGLNTFPFNLFFIPYYAFAITSFFGHIASIHHRKMTRTIVGLTPARQSRVIIFLGLCLTAIILFGLTNHFKGVQIPEEYNVLIGK